MHNPDGLPRSRTSVSKTAPLTSPPVVQEAGSNIKVVVRVRPFNEREKGEVCCVKMPPGKRQVVLEGGPKAGGRGAHRFEFDRAFWSHDHSGHEFATQQLVMDEMGTVIVDDALNGYNICVFAYGQTGSGKTHTILGCDGDPEQQGLIPRVIEGIFNKIDHGSKLGIKYRCQVSYLEIYKEHIRDLLVPLSNRGQESLQVRQHKKLGFIVPGLTENAVTKLEEVKKLLDFGFKTRVVASTSMNSSSSRSHCVFCFNVDREQIVNGKKSQLRARLNLVDLAGSERQTKAESEGERLKEGATINCSLLHLSTVINKLAEGDAHVPYRNSKLTYLLQESLCGNSKTAIVAAISPAASNFDENLGTLRFAATCKKIVTHAHKNEESSESIIGDLQHEILRLKKALGGMPNNPEAMSQLQATESLRSRFEEDHHLQLAEAKKREADRDMAMLEMGLTYDDAVANAKLDKNVPMLMNISEDPALSGCLVYFLPSGESTTIGSSKECKIVLLGLGVRPYMCSIMNVDNRHVTLTPYQISTPKDGKEAPGRASRRSCQNDVTGVSRVLVNGHVVTGFKELHNLDRVIIGHSHCFRVTKRGGSKIGTRGSQRFAYQKEEFAELMGEICNTDKPEVKECEAMFRSFEERYGSEATQQFLRQFADALPMVEEGNSITSELRPDEWLRFQLEVSSDVMSFTLDEPELMVRLYQDHEDGSAAVLAIYEFPHFQGMLVTMREIYEHTALEMGIDKMTYDPSVSKTFGDPWFLHKFGESPQDVLALQTHMAELSELIELRNMHIVELVSALESNGVEVPDRKKMQDLGLYPLSDMVEDTDVSNPYDAMRNSSAGVFTSSGSGAIIPKEALDRLSVQWPPTENNWHLWLRSLPPEHEQFTNGRRKHHWKP